LFDDLTKHKMKSNKSSYALLTTLMFPYERIFICGTMMEAGIKTWSEECICDAENPFFEGRSPLINIYVNSQNFAMASRILGKTKCYKRFRVDTYCDPEIKDQVIAPRNTDRKICRYCFFTWLVLFGSVVASILRSVHFSI